MSVDARPRPALRDLAAAQDRDGCFASWVEREPGRPVADRNGFVTALVVRALRNLPRGSDEPPLLRRALGWLERCRSATRPGAFCFWPEGSRPAWAAGLPADADDTAVVTTELLRHGRLDATTALRTVCRVLVPQRLDPRAPAPPWVVPGAFLTWLGRPAPNPVDACVNANVVALLARLDGSHLPGYAAAIDTIDRGLAWAGSDPARLSALTPFYPGPHSLAEALAHAVECGAEPLQHAAARAAALTAAGPPSVRRGEFRSAYGRSTWYAPVLDDARRLAATATHPERSEPCHSPAAQT